MLQLIGVCRDGTGKLCGEPAPFRLTDPSGMLVPGCFMCEAHALSVIKEYADKLGQSWGMIDVRTGKPVELPSLIYRCTICNKGSKLVNACGCDPNNKPTTLAEFLDDLLNPSHPLSQEQ